MEYTLNKKIILAIRPRYDFESEDEYSKVPYNKRLKAYLVLDTLNEGLLVARFKYLENRNESYYTFFKSEYPGLNYASLPDGTVQLIPKRNVKAVLSHDVQPLHFEKTLSFLLLRIAYDCETSINFAKFCERYYRNYLRIGSVVTILNADGSFSTYYVKEKKENDFLARVLHYDYINGLSVTDEEVYLPYDSRYDLVMYTDEYKDYVESLIEEHRLKLLDNK